MSDVNSAEFDTVFAQLINLINTQREIIHELADYLDQLEIGGGGGGPTSDILLRKMSDDDYEALDPKDPNTVYYVYDDNGDYKHYIGDKPLDGGGGSTGGLSFMKISEEDYEALDPKDPDTVYYVYDENGRYKQYIGGKGIEMLAITAGGVIPKMNSNPGFNMIQGIASTEE